MTFADYPLHEIADTVERLLAEGHTVYQKFTCSGCGARLTMERPNVLYASGECECGHKTTIERCNILVIMEGGRNG